VELLAGEIRAVEFNTGAAASFSDYFAFCVPAAIFAFMKFDWEAPHGERDVQAGQLRKLRCSHVENASGDIGRSWLLQHSESPHLMLRVPV
jgi:hypothetical protein